MLTLPGGTSIEYGEYGDPAGRPLLFFHGWPSSQLQAAYAHASAVRRKIRIIAPNRPGIGRSTFQAGRTLGDWPPLVCALAEHLALPRLPILGISGGGPYALACAADLPHLVSAVGVSGSAVPLAEIPDRGDLMFPYRALLALKKFAPWLLAPIIQTVRILTKVPPHRFPTSLALRLLDTCDREALRDSSAYFAVMASFREAAASGTKAVLADGEIFLQDWNTDLLQIRCPAYFWHGAKDRNIPLRMAEILAAKVPEARCRWFPDEGHFSLALGKLDLFFESLTGDPGSTPE